MSSFSAKVLTGGVLAVIGLLTVKIVLALVSGFMALMSFMLFTVLPILLIGWLVMRVIKYLRSSSEKPAMD